MSWSRRSQSCWARRVPDNLAERFRAFAQAQRQQPSPDPHAEFDVALLVAQLIDPELSQSHCRAALADLLRQLNPKQTPWENLQALNFSGNQDNYEAIDNSAIHRVIHNRTGLPITLAVLLIEAARATGHIAGGVNHPGHFLVRIEDQLIDPFAMTLLTDEAPQALSMPAVTAVEMGLRMLNNLKYGYVRALVWHEALTVVSYQLALVPDHPQLLCEKGDYWAELGGVGAANEAYQMALVQAEQADSKLRHKINERLQRLAATGPETLH